MGKPRFTPKKEKISLEPSQVLTIARKALVDKLPCRSIAKEMRLKPRLVSDIVAAKSHRDYWIDAIATLAKEGALGGSDSDC